MADAQPPSLPASWTEHVAPTGHIYFHNAATKESTYRRPTAVVAGPQQPQQPQQPHSTAFPPQALPPAPFLRLSDPRVANAFIAQLAKPADGPVAQRPHGRPNDRRPAHQLPDKPIAKTAIPGHEPWLLVQTKRGRRFVHNLAKNASYWRIPDKLQPAIREMDRARILNKVQDNMQDTSNDYKAPAETPAVQTAAEHSGSPPNDSASEYEEVEVEEGEEDEEDEDGKSYAKRQRQDNGRAEFGEDDIAFQLQAAAEEYAYDVDNMDDWAAAADEADDAGDMGEEDAATTFMALLDDCQVSPYSSWENVVEEGKIIEDPRYTVLHSMKARKAVWEDWSRTRIQTLKAQKAQTEAVDPLLAYLAFLQAHASPRLFWAEFKRKHRKAAVLRDLALSEREKEKWYRDLVSHLKRPQATRTADFAQLLNGLPAADVAGGVLPARVHKDVRYVCLDPQVREPLVEAFLQAARTERS